MPYAVLQTNLETPTIEQLTRACRSVPGLTPADAPILGKDAFGILVEDFSAAQAGALQGALRAEGVETEIVEQTLLPVLPPTKFVHRLDCTPEHLLIYDPLEKTFALEWRHIMFIAAGAVRLTEFVREQRQPKTRVTSGRYQTGVYFDSDTKEERHFHSVAEIIITGAALRYSLTADKFNFAGLGERNMQNITANFSMLVRDLVQFGAQAALNRGAEALSQDATKIFSYPSKNAFYGEIVWSLWQMKKGGQ